MYNHFLRRKTIMTKNIDGSIKVIATPNGAAPVCMREEWVGLTLPVVGMTSVKSKSPEIISGLFHSFFVAGFVGSISLGFIKGNICVSSRVLPASIEKRRSPWPQPHAGGMPCWSISTNS